MPRASADILYPKNCLRLHIYHIKAVVKIRRPPLHFYGIRGSSLCAYRRDQAKSVKRREERYRNQTAASVVHNDNHHPVMYNDNHHPVMYLVGKVISVGLERLAD